MKIAIVGTGHIGSNLARIFARNKHEISIANSSNSQALRDLAAEIGATPAAVQDVAKGADVVILSIPQKRAADLPAGFLDHAAPGAVVVDTGNYYPLHRDGLIAPIEQGMPESRWVEQQIKRPVIKAFNATNWYNLTQEIQSLTPTRFALPVSGDDAAAKEIVFRLVTEAGFDPVDAGGLDESWRQQPGTPAYCTDLGVEAMRQALSAAAKERKPESSAIRATEEERKAAQETQIAFYQSFDNAIQLLMAANQWTEAAATQRLVAQFMAGKHSIGDIFAYVFEHKRLLD
ncbi:NAD(P)-binding domain-containing protein [Paenibacillus sp. MWE-103]|uniref:NAD(P)-binding domain-containing protein n=1 Tax=Paenibacillus artemisiicola TaxID=1172618 RepID=A0ABS3W4Y3_9BACL|nr:NAD(P)-binding domain-containing protein [Paenibacillus artemisiicola]MBO7743370.1 NAD(P)-binding domain-containing protein [Paenibacillus artemisiicola]